MAVTPVSVPALQSATLSPPGRPSGPRQPLLVPGQPQALPHRSEQSSGRLPVAGLKVADEVLTRIKAMDREIRDSIEYQVIIKPFLEEKGLLEGDRGKAPPSPSQPEPESATSSAPQAPASSKPIHIERHRFTPTAVARAVAESRARGEGQVERSDPLALDLDGDGLETTGVANGVRFDIDADGDIDTTSFITGGDAFVALDRNGNGRIDDGSELFGDQNGDANGYEALARYDENSDGHIDRSDAIYQQLRLLSLGVNGQQQLQRLEAAGIASIGLSYQNSTQALNRYDTIAQYASYQRSDGTKGLSGDLLLGHTSD